MAIISLPEEEPATGGEESRQEPEGIHEGFVGVGLAVIKIVSEPNAREREREVGGIREGEEIEDLFWLRALNFTPKAILPMLSRVKLNMSP
jgi:hypothetical protein